MNEFIDRCLTKTISLKKVIFVSLFSILCLISCIHFGHRLFSERKTGTEILENKNSLQKVLSQKKLRVVLDYNTFNYFIYKGEPMGFYYELLKAFCDENEIRLEIIDQQKWAASVRGLMNETYDLVAKNTIPVVNVPQIDCTEPLALSHVVLVQHQPVSVIDNGGDETSDGFVKYRNELKGKKVFVPQNSDFGYLLKLLSNDIGGITIVEDSLHTTEQLLKKVATREIDYTVCDENSLAAMKQHFPDLDFSTTIRFGRNLCWALANESLALKNYLNEWILAFKKTSKYEEIYARYFSVQADGRFRDGEYNSFLGGQLSEFDDLVKEVSAYYHWDWRLISSIIFQESRFDVHARSFTGARGLMQLMPNIIRLYKVANPAEPRENIRAGVAYLTYLDQLFLPVIADKTERLKFVLASYNIGVGHVMDARKLAMKFDKDPSVWEDNVDYFLKNKTSSMFSDDPIVKWGGCRGEESVNFVFDVLNYYYHYLNIFPPGDRNSLAEL